MQELQIMSSTDRAGELTGYAGDFAHRNCAPRRQLLLQGGGPHKLGCDPQASIGNTDIEYPNQGWVLKLLEQDAHITSASPLLVVETHNERLQGHDLVRARVERFVDETPPALSQERDD